MSSKLMMLVRRTVRQLQVRLAHERNEKNEINPWESEDPSFPSWDIPLTTERIHSLLSFLSSPQYLRITNQEDLALVQIAVQESEFVGLVLETTGFNPRTDRIRLLSLDCATIDNTRFTYLIDSFVVDPSPLFDVLQETTLIIHNSMFDLSFLMQLQPDFQPKVVDTMLLSQLLNAGTPEDRPSERIDCVQRELGITLDAPTHISDWNTDLSEQQLLSAARNAGILLPLYRKLQRKILDADLLTAGVIEQRAIPCLVQMSLNGVGIDRHRWQQQVEKAKTDADHFEREFRRQAPKRSDGTEWNLNSSQQMLELFAQLGISLTKTDDQTLSQMDHPLARILRAYRHCRIRSTTYGLKWLGEYLAENGRVYPHWLQMGAAATGRMSCSKPNMQQLPRKDYRPCIVASPGHVLVKGDYSQIELRIAAKISNDPELLNAYHKGEDLHTYTAKRVLGLDQVTKQDRQLAKAINFGLLFGMGVKGFREYVQSQFGISLSNNQASSYRDAFFQSYPGLSNWHRLEKVLHKSETRSLAKRRRLLTKDQSDTIRLNAPVQGTGADGLKTALALLWERRSECPEAKPILAIHDEIVLEVPEDQANLAADWLKRCMIDAMRPLLDPVPVEVDVCIGKNWAMLE